MAEVLAARDRVDILDQTWQLKIEMGWVSDPNCDPAYELDAVAVLTNSGGHIRHRLDLVTYDSENTITFNGEEHPCSYDESVIGPSAYEDDEVAPGVGRTTLFVDLHKTDERVKTILFALCLFWNETNPRDKRLQYHFGELSNIYISLKDQNTDQELVRFVLDPQAVNHCKGAERGKLYRRGDSWRFMAIEQGLKNGWEDIMDLYAKGPLESPDF